MVLKEEIFNSFYFGYSFHFGQVWWSWKNLFLTVSLFGGCGDPKKSDF